MGHVALAIMIALFAAKGFLCGMLYEHMREDKKGE